MILASVAKEIRCVRPRRFHDILGTCSCDQCSCTLSYTKKFKVNIYKPTFLLFSLHSSVTVMNNVLEFLRCIWTEARSINRSFIDTVISGYRQNFLLSQSWTRLLFWIISYMTTRWYPLELSPFFQHATIY